MYGCVLCACDGAGRNGGDRGAGARAAVAAPLDGGAKGPYEVGFRHLALVDGSRNVSTGGRHIPVYVWYPTDAADVTASTARASYPLDTLYDAQPRVSSTAFESLGIDAAYGGTPASSHRPFPLVIFSPGWGLDANFYIYLGTRLASHGFVVAVLTHQGDGYGGVPTVLVDTFDHVAQALFNRPRDVSFALTNLLEANRTRGDVFYGMIKPNHVAAGGHSLGGYAALVLGGAGDDSICDSTGPDSTWMGPPPPEFCVSSAADHRFRAIFYLDAANQYLRFAEMQRINLPTQGIGQDPDSLSAVPPPWGSWQARTHAAIDHPRAYRADLKHIIHLSLANFCQTQQVWFDNGIIGQEAYDFANWWACGPTAPILADGPLLPSLETQRLVGKLLVPFLNTHLVDEARNLRMLEPACVNASEENVAFFATERGGDTHEGPGAAYLDPSWTDEFDYFLHPPMTSTPGHSGGHGCD